MGADAAMEHDGEGGNVLSGAQRVKGGFAGGLYGIGNADQTGCVAVERK